MMNLENFAELFDAGITIGGDMTTEAAYCKLLYLLGKYPNRQNVDVIKSQIMINLRGELSTNMYVAQAEDDIIIDKLMPPKLIRGLKFGSVPSKKSVARITIRVKGLRVDSTFSNSISRLNFVFAKGLDDIEKIIKFDNSETAVSFNIDVPLTYKNLLKDDEFCFRATAFTFLVE